LSTFGHTDFSAKSSQSFGPLFVKIPDSTLPAAIRSPKNVVICSEPFLWHGWWFLPSDFFISHKRYRAAFGYIQTNIGNRAKENA
jgi:hypothetical protein